MKPNDTYKNRHFGCILCHREQSQIQWNYDAPPVCCDQPMTEGVTDTTTLQIITDDVPGGFTVENGFSKPTTFYSKSAHRQALAARGKRIADKGEFRY